MKKSSQASTPSKSLFLTVKMKMSISSLSLSRKRSLLSLLHHLRLLNHPLMILISHPNHLMSLIKALSRDQSLNHALSLNRAMVDQNHRGKTLSQMTGKDPNLKAVDQ